MLIVKSSLGPDPRLRPGTIVELVQRAGSAVLKYGVSSVLYSEMVDRQSFASYCFKDTIFNPKIFMQFLALVKKVDLAKPMQLKALEGLAGWFKAASTSMQSDVGPIHAIWVKLETQFGGKLATPPGPVFKSHIRQFTFNNSLAIRPYFGYMDLKIGLITSRLQLSHTRIHADLQLGSEVWLLIC
ncbi:hypothetical protein VNO77_27528 [Canavalia gladiata]|uniref:Uncharacterized protein n=1 Tax=Canavalia gladiata TaxID=3824 RepID=A0AAN9Q483_CANGL